LTLPREVIKKTYIREGDALGVYFDETNKIVCLIQGCVTYTTPSGEQFTNEDIKRGQNI
jgi:hypothetical protein